MKMASVQVKTVSLRRLTALEKMDDSPVPKSMHVDEREVDEVRRFLWPGETVELTVKQRKIRPGGSLITPTSFVATNKRLIIINRTRLGVRKDFEVIPYRYITAVKLLHGLFSCSVLIRVSSVDSGDGKGQNEAIGGIRPSEAEVLVHFLNKRMIEVHQQTDKQKTPEPAEQKLEVRFCTECGSKNSAIAKFCASCGASSVVEV
ncbi:MAG TPA: PH domain-containing protein [Candidatus Acidoferrales bacterium]|nr:PH domain-containing protein [Candidatus Acidoferrales bacterium]